MIQKYLRDKTSKNLNDDQSYKIPMGKSKKDIGSSSKIQMNEMPKIQQNNGDENDEIGHYAKELATFLRQLSPANRRKDRIGIDQVLLEFEQ